MVRFIIEELDGLIDNAIFHDTHNVIVYWGEMGRGKSTLGLWTMFRLVKRNLARKKGLPEEYVKMKYKQLVKVDPEFCREVWELILGKYVVFTFREFRGFVKAAMKVYQREDGVMWDDVAVYFSRIGIMYMHPEVKEFFSTYNFIREYLANAILTVPVIDDVPRQMLRFMTGDVNCYKRGEADFKRAKTVRTFGKGDKSWSKLYDGFDLVWPKVPDWVYTKYKEMRHEHAMRAMEDPDSVFVSKMPDEDKLFE